MSGSGHNDGGPLGGKIKDELLSALKLLFKSAEHHIVNLAIDADATIYLTDIPCDSVDVPLKPQEIEVSADPIRVLAERETPTTALKLLESVELAAGSPCQLEPALCKEPIFGQMSFASMGISFENLATKPPLVWPVEKTTTEAKSPPVEKVAKPAVKRIASESISAKSHSALAQFATLKTRPDQRFFTLPIRKAPIPPHRFSIAVREKFREALAEKDKTHAANVQLKMVFERMHMALYASIQPDELGNLLCIPKNEVLERPGGTRSSQTAKSGSPGEASYLVVGVRLDNKADIRALVPADSLPRVPEGGDIP